MNAVDDAIRAGAAAGAEAGFLAALRNPTTREILAEIIRAEVAKVVPSLMRPEEVFRRYGIPLSTQRQMRREGHLRATKVGRVVLIDVSQLRPVGADEITAMAAEARR